MLLGAIDIGSNAVRLLISEVKKLENNLDFQKRCFVRVPIRLGADVFKHGIVLPSHEADLKKAMLAFANLLEVFKVAHHMACATAAMREAANGKQVAAAILQSTGIDIQIVAGNTEARLLHSINVAQKLSSQKNYLYIDVGGGSTELTVFANNQIIASSSFAIGTVRYMLNAIEAETWENLKQWLAKHISGNKNIVGIGTGGNINKIFKLQAETKDKTISRLNIKNVKEYLENFSLQQRIDKLGLREDRADVIIPACEIFLTIMKWADMDEMIVPKLGLADGIINKLFQDNL